MKTIKFLSTIGLVVAVLIVSATEKPKMNVISLSEEKALIAAANENPAYFELSIIAKNGDLVYYKESAKEITDLRQVIDYSNLENGVYTLKLKVNDTFVSRDFEKNAKGIVTGESKTEYAPYFVYDSNILKLSYLNFKRENIQFRIFSNGELVFENRLGNGFVLTEGYDLSKLDKGKYEVELASLNKNFIYEIEK